MDGSAENSFIVTASRQDDHNSLQAMPTPAAHRWIKSACGRERYAELAARSGPWAALRLRWFVAIAALRDWRLPPSPEDRQGAASASDA